MRSFLCGGPKVVLSRAANNNNNNNRAANNNPKHAQPQDHPHQPQSKRHRRFLGFSLRWRQPAAAEVDEKAVVDSPYVKNQSTKAHLPGMDVADMVDFDGHANIDDKTKAACAQALRDVFPAICPDFLARVSQRFHYNHHLVLDHLLDQLDAGKPFPLRASRKRKRRSGSSEGVGGAAAEHNADAVQQGSGAAAAAAAAAADNHDPHADSLTIIARLEAADAAYAADVAAAAAAPEVADNTGSEADQDERENEKRAADSAREARAIAAFSTEARVAFCQPRAHAKQASILLRQAYRKTPAKYTETLLRQHRNCLLPALLALETMVAAAAAPGGDPLPYSVKKRSTVLLPEYAAGPGLVGMIRVSLPGSFERDLLYEYELALRLRDARRDAAAAAARRAQDEADNLAQAQRDGTVRTCECCYADEALNRMVHCEGGGEGGSSSSSAADQHYFCRTCARRHAETQIGLLRYELVCMSTSGCQGGFARDQRRRFLSSKTTRALERIEQDYVLRVAGLEGLARCPFCPFAAEYPPVEVNKEFVCLNPECEAVTCRLCQGDTHIPQTCEEAAAEAAAAAAAEAAAKDAQADSNKPNARLAVEEAMSKAMIRNCNRCHTPFIKENGCNKMTCTNTGCGNVQCYVCHQSCDYSHFDDAARGGRSGNCPLFESAEQRHEAEVQAAEARARAEVVQQNPNVDPKTLRFELSERVLADERQRQLNDRVRLVGR